MFWKTLKPSMGEGGWFALGVGFGLAETGASLLLGVAAFAQVIPDGTLGEEVSTVRSGEVNNLPAEVIEGGAARGTNLFHSFDAFNVGAGQRLYFANPAGIANILGRVTGNSASTINGLLGVDGVANLYLLNPNGIVFGPGAQLDIRGSFTASTAESLVFVDGSVFSAANPAIPSQLLTLSVVPGVQYGSQAASIVNQGNLAVDQDLTLAAQRLELSGQLAAGRDIVLQGQERQLSNANYRVGGYLFTQDLTGQGVEFVNPHSNVIIANGDVRFNEDYSGPSLRVLAGGQVTQAPGAGAITITDPDPDPEGGSTTETVQDGLGGVQSITVNATNEPTIDIRSNVNWQQVRGGLPGNEKPMSLDVTFGDGVDPNAVTAGGIALEIGQPGSDGNTVLINPGGRINLSAAANITTGNLDSSSREVNGQPGGTVSISSNFGDIRIGDVDSQFDFVSGGSGGSGGNISLSSYSGNIIAGRLDSRSSVDGNSGAGGEISVFSHEGNITIESLNSTTFSFNGNTGPGGAILISSHVGDIAINFLSSTSFAFDDGDAGVGGDISISSYFGNINTGGLNSSSSSRRGIAGSGGNIFISSYFGDIINNVGLNSTSFSEAQESGTGGAISISSQTGNITTNLVDASSFSDKGAAGMGGTISVYSETGNLTLNNRLAAYSYSVSGSASSSGSIILAAPGGSIRGVASEITASDGSIELRNPQLAASSVVDIQKGGGTTRTGGSVTLQARNEITGLEIITVSLRGDSGPVEIQGFGDLVIQDTELTTNTQITTISPYNPDNPLITLDINNVGQAGDTRIISSGSITFDNVQILSNAYGTNPAGGVTIISPSGVTFQNSSKININTNNIARAGDLNLQAPAVVFNDSTSGLYAQTTSSGSAGNITLQPYPGGQTLAVTFAEGARITASTTATSTGQGGSVTLTAPVSVTIQGRGGIYSETSGFGSAGNLNITTGDLTIQDGATLSVSSSTIAPTANPALAADTTPGNAGNINFNTRSLRLNNQASLQAVTASGEGGNINLAATEVLALRRNSFISTEAGGSGNGGNINANAGIVVTVPNENNDIIANAFSGSGGRVNLTANRILGFTPLSGFTTAQLRSNTSSDLSASSQDGPQGTVAVSNLAIDPSQALAELPVTFSDVTNQIAQGCRVNPAAAQSQFVITGRGGLPPSPSDPLASEPSDFPWATRNLEGATAPASEVIPQGEIPASPALVEAQGWVREANGDIVFVTTPTTAVTPAAELLTATACPDYRAP